MSEKSQYKLMHKVDFIIPILIKLYLVYVSIQWLSWKSSYICTWQLTSISVIITLIGVIDELYLLSIWFFDVKDSAISLKRPLCQHHRLVKCRCVVKQIEQRKQLYNVCIFKRLNYCTSELLKSMWVYET